MLDLYSTNTSVLSLKKNIIATFLTQFPVIVIGVITGVLITRMLGAEGKGAYAIMMSNIELFTLFFGLNISFGATYFISKKSFAIQRILGMGILFIILGTVLFSIFLFTLFSFFQKNIFFTNNINATFFYWYCFLAFSTNTINSLISGMFSGLKRFNVINVMSLFMSLINVISFSALYMLLELGLAENIKNVFLMSSLILVVNSLVWISVYLFYIGKMPSFSINKKMLKVFLLFIIVGYASNLVNFLNYKVDIWILGYYVDLKDIGYYSLAVNIAQMLWLVTIPMTLVLQPYLNSPNETSKIEKFELFSRLNSSLVIVLGIFLLVFGGSLVPLLYGEEFMNSIVSMNILLIGILFASYSKLFAILMINAAKVKYNLYATIFGLVATLILDFLLIPKIGIIGASIASSSAYFVIFASLYFFASKKINLPNKNYFFFKLKDIKKIKEL